MIETRLIPRGAVPLTSVGFGASGIAGLYRAVPLAQAHDALQCAWDSGIRYFDTAPFYGHGLSERRLGDFLRSFPRDSYTLSTKVGRLLVPEQGALPDNGFAEPLPFRPVFDYSYDGVMRSFEHSLQRLGLSRIDMLYVHDIGRQTHGGEHARHREQLLAGGLRALQALRSSGAVKAIGLGVNEVEICLDVMSQCELDCILLAIRLTLLDRSAEAQLVGECERRGVALVIGGVFNSGILATGAVPGAHFDYAPASESVLQAVRRLEGVAQRHDVELAAAALQFPYRFATTASVLIGTARADSLRRNLALMAQPVPAAAWPAFDAARKPLPEASSR